MRNPKIPSHFPETDFQQKRQKKKEKKESMDTGKNVERHCSGLENAVHNVRTNRRAGTEDSCNEITVSACISPGLLSFCGHDLPALPIFFPNFLPFSSNLVGRRPPGVVADDPSWLTSSGMFP
jgi:hypothetical protein